MPASIHIHYSQATYRCGVQNECITAFIWSVDPRAGYQSMAVEACKYLLVVDAQSLRIWKRSILFWISSRHKMRQDFKFILYL